MPEHQKDTEIYNIFSDASTRWLLIMLVSIFEFYLWKLCEINNIKKWKIHENIKKLEGQLGICLKQSIWDELYYWLPEIVQRRNSYVHKNWVIDQEYIDMLKKYTKEDTDNLVVWHKLAPISIIYIKKVLITLISTLVTLSIYLLNKRKELDDDFLWLMGKVVSLSKNRDHILYSISTLISKDIDIYSFPQFSLLTISNLYNELPFYKKHNQEYFIWWIIFKYQLLLILTWLFKDKDKVFYFALTGNDNKFREIINQKIISEDDDIFFEILSIDIVWRKFIEKYKESLSQF